MVPNACPNDVAAPHEPSRRLCLWLRFSKMREVVAVFRGRLVPDGRRTPGSFGPVQGRAIKHEIFIGSRKLFEWRCLEFGTACWRAASRRLGYRLAHSLPERKM